ncbi:MAG: fumarylacetoacetate hydrolase family protein [Sterolibacterium sp.]
MTYVFPPPALPSLPVAGSSERYAVRRVYCVGRNYAAHAREMGFDPDRDPPFFFAKPADAVVAVLPGATAEIPYPSATQDYQHEIELVVAIGRAGADIDVSRALDHAWGYAVGLDMTRRDLQLALRNKGCPWEPGKAFDASAPIGPITPAAQVPGVDKAAIWLAVNGIERQRATIDHLIWNIAETIAHLSKYFRLAPGDLIFTGTPEGVGKVVLGDMLVGGIDGLGEISVRIV